ncbi:hypothetical protein, partial [Rhodoblastus sp.]|uniref:hypothetical protein n=1 Tax=Rhodoblastus sp. TaxID=1962975 RepID=UPI003F965C60
MTKIRHHKAVIDPARQLHDLGHPSWSCRGCAVRAKSDRSSGWRGSFASLAENSTTFRAIRADQGRFARAFAGAGREISFSAFSIGFFAAIRRPSQARSLIAQPVEQA